MNILANSVMSTKAAPVGGEAHNGYTFVPNVSVNGIISWINDGGLVNPIPRDITGPDGKTGADGGRGADGRNGQNGVDGSNGLTPYIKNSVWWIGETDTGVVAVGVKGADGTRGFDGTNGKAGVNGNTPYIQGNHWWIDGVDTGVVARGADGVAGTNGSPATINGKNTLNIGAAKYIEIISVGETLTISTNYDLDDLIRNISAVATNAATDSRKALEDTSDLYNITNRLDTKVTDLQNTQAATTTNLTKAQEDIVKLNNAILGLANSQNITLNRLG